MSTTRSARPAQLGLLVVIVASLLVACASSAAPSGSAGAPGASSGDGPAASHPQLSPSTDEPSAGPDDPVTGPSDPGGGDPGAGGDLVIPQPGTLNPHPVSVEGIEANVDGRHVTAKLTWTSGVEPCYVLDSVVVSRDGTTIDLTVVEGTGDPNAICIEIAKTKSTIVDLGELEPGTYTISATDSQIPPITVTVS
jgi:hypothetical protein